jgi:beta-phosphoglucomutase-like phosphatase (HAD superfamily)
MSTELRALIFDVDGTLADTEEFHRRAFNAAFSAADLHWWWNRTTYRELLRVAGGRQRMRAFAEREDRVTTQRADFEELLTALHAAKTRRYDASLREEPLPLRPGISRLYEEAANEHRSLANPTTTTAANLDALLEPHFANARSIRNALDRARLRQARRLLDQGGPWHLYTSPSPRDGATSRMPASA